MRDATALAHSADRAFTLGILNTLTIRFSGFIATYNSERFLAECLSSLSFCEELFVVDVGSTDATIEIAEGIGATVVRHEWVPFGEKLWPEVLGTASNDWIVRIDSDEIFPSEAVDALVELITENRGLAAVGMPYQNFYLGRPLSTTIWGGVNHKFDIVFHRGRVQLLPWLHRGISPAPGFPTARLEAPGSYVKHHWITTRRELITKHKARIDHDGESLYMTGERFSWTKVPKWTVAAFKESFIDRVGWRGGWTGFLLSIVRSWYVAIALLALRRYERRVA